MFFSVERGAPASLGDRFRTPCAAAHFAANSFDATQAQGSCKIKQLPTLLKSMPFRSSDHEARNMATDFGRGNSGHRALLPARFTANSSLLDVPTARSGFVGIIQEQAAASCHVFKNFSRDDDKWILFTERQKAKS